MIKKHKKIHHLKSLLQYGVHIWAILIIANAALAYAFHFSTQASTEVMSAQQAGDPTTAPEDQEEPKETVKPSRPLGTAITLAFTIPGVGSGSANMTPTRLQREVIFFLYSPDANSLNKSVKPLYTIKTKANYDTGTQSPTYTSYVVNGFDFGSDVKEGKYQIAFRTDESLRTLIKESPDNVGGQLFDIKRNVKIRKIPIQKVLMGDTLPKDGDNTVDISDYNAFVNCFGERMTTEFCTGSNYGDFDDNGVIDGVDYNLLLRSFSALLAQGQSIPKITSAPTGPARVSRLSNLTTPTVAEKKPQPTKAADIPPARSSSGGNILGGILFFFFVLIAGATTFVLYKKNEKFRNIIAGILKKSPIGPPPADPNAPPTAEAEQTPAATNESAVPTVQETTAGTSATPEAPIETPTADAQADPSAVAASTEIPVAQPTAVAEPSAPEAIAPIAEPNTVVASTEIPVDTPVQTIPAAGESVEKDCYIKKKLPGDATGVWLMLTDDNGALEAHYNNPEVQEGFAKVKGVMKTENGKTFLEISEIVDEG